MLRSADDDSVLSRRRFLIAGGCAAATHTIFQESFVGFGQGSLLLADPLLMRVKRLLKKSSFAHDPSGVIAQMIKQSANEEVEEVLTHKHAEVTRTVAAMLTNAAFMMLLGARSIRYREVVDDIFNRYVEQGIPQEDLLQEAELALALALSCSWVSQTDLAPRLFSVKKAMESRFLSRCVSIYAGNQPRSNFSKLDHNWNPVCNVAALTAALVFYDADDPARHFVICSAINSLTNYSKTLSCVGREGVNYWMYAMTFYVIGVEILAMAGYSNEAETLKKALNNNSHYWSAMHGPSGKVFNYSDCPEKVSVTHFTTWLHLQSCPYSLANYLILRDFSRDGINPNGILPLHLIWMARTNSVELSNNRADLPPKPGARLAVASGQANKKTFYLGVKGGSNIDNHSHLDLGTFVYEHDDIRWFTDPGAGDYRTPGYFDVENGQRFKSLAIQTKSHSLFFPSEEQQSTHARASIVVTDSSTTPAFLIDLTDAYKKYASKAVRTFSISKDGGLRIVDRITNGCKVLTWVTRLVTSHPVNVLEGSVYVGTNREMLISSSLEIHITKLNLRRGEDLGSVPNNLYAVSSMRRLGVGETIEIEVNIAPGGTPPQRGDAGNAVKIWTFS